MESFGPDKEIGARFRYARTEHLDPRLLQSEVAKQLGVSLSHYSKIEAGNNSFSRHVAEAFCKKFGISFSWLISGEGEPGSVGGAEGGPDDAEIDLGRIAKLILDDTLRSKADVVANTLGISIEDAMRIVLQVELRQ